jgi:hypothetical protein
VLRGQPEHKASRAFKVPLARKALRVSRAQPGYKAYKVLKAQPEHKASKVFKVPLAHKAYRVCKV